MFQDIPVVILLGDMNDEFCSDFTNSDSFDFVNIDLPFDGYVFLCVLLVPLRL